MIECDYTHLPIIDKWEHVLSVFSEYSLLIMLIDGVKIDEGEKIFVPPLELQLQFASRITKIYEIKKEAHRTCQELQELLASRMQYWFD